jgi:hypothetical protein
MVRPQHVIAGAAKQSKVPPRKDSGLLRCARNDDVAATQQVSNQPFTMSRRAHPQTPDTLRETTELALSE